MDVIEELDNVIHTCKGLQIHVTKEKDIHNRLKTEVGELHGVIQALRDEVENLKSSLLATEQLLQHAKNEVKGLEEERSAFSKVSQIIAMEKENARLKRDIDHLQQQLTRHQPPVSPQVSPSPSNQPTSQTVVVVSHTVIDPIVEQGLMYEEQEKTPPKEEVTVDYEAVQSLHDSNKNNDISITTEHVKKCADIEHNEIDNDKTEDDENIYIKKIKGVSYYVSHVDGTIYHINDDSSKGDKVGVLKKTLDGKTKVSWS